MGNIQGNVPDFAKAVISLWFNVPAAAIAAARAQFMSVDVNTIVDNGGVFPGVLLGKLPLVVFGPNPTASTSNAGFSGSGPIGPSFIGVNCGMRILTKDPVPDPIPSLCCQFNYSGQDVIMDLEPQPTHWVLPNRFEIGFYGNSVTFFEFEPTVGDPGDGSTNVNVNPDEWHHLLISFDFSHSGACPFYWALDDVNYNDGYLWPAKAVASGPNDVWSSAYESKPNGALPVGTLGIPATSEYADQLYRTIMAHFQIFTGETIDTGDVAMRRLFVDDNGEPTDPAIPIEFFGKLPEVAFHAGTDWRTGTNVGSGGNFTPAGTILKTSPDPKLGA